MVSVVMFVDDSVFEMLSLACPSYCQLLTAFALIKKPTYHIRHGLKSECLIEGIQHLQYRQGCCVQCFHHSHIVWGSTCK